MKRAYRFSRPKPGLFRSRRLVDVEIDVSSSAIVALGRVVPRDPNEKHIEIRVAMPGSFEPARNPEQTAQAAREAFGKLGDTGLQLGTFQFRNEGCFVPISQWNALRRTWCEAVERAIEQERLERVQRTQAAVCPPARPSASTGFRWSIKIDRLSFLDQLEPSDWQDLDELIVDITRDSLNVLENKLALWCERMGHEHIRLALPALTRKWEEKPLLQKIERLRAAGWSRWEAANLSAWSYLDIDPSVRSEGALDLAADWSLYVLNRLAAEQLLSMSVTRFALSPEDGLANMGSLLAEYGSKAVVIVHQDTPLFLAESCRLCQLDRRLPRQSQLPIREHGDDLQLWRTRNGLRLSLPHDRPQRRPLLPGRSSD